VLERLAAEISLPISIDTYKWEVARRALEAGASILNDIWGLKQDPRLAELAAEKGIPLVLMHNQQGTSYEALIPEVMASLKQSLKLALDRGVAWKNLIIDPGIGFGKTLEHNLEILRRLEEFKTLGRPILLGTSRKSVIGRVLDLPSQERLEGTAATVAIGITKGADIVRVHDVAQMVRVCRMSDAIVRGKG
jgi:dihydropteroate synthase